MYTIRLHLPPKGGLRAMIPEKQNDIFCYAVLLLKLRAKWCFNKNTGIK